MNSSGEDLPSEREKINQRKETRRKPPRFQPRIAPALARSGPVLTGKDAHKKHAASEHEARLRVKHQNDNPTAAQWDELLRQRNENVFHPSVDLPQVSAPTSSKEQRLQQAASERMLRSNKGRAYIENDPSPLPSPQLEGSLSNYRDEDPQAWAYYERKQQEREANKEAKLKKRELKRVKQEQDKREKRERQQREHQQRQREHLEQRQAERRRQEELQAERKVNRRNKEAAREEARNLREAMKARNEQRREAQQLAREAEYERQQSIRETSRPLNSGVTKTPRERRQPREPSSPEPSLASTAAALRELRAAERDRQRVISTDRANARSSAQSSEFTRIDDEIPPYREKLHKYLDLVSYDERFTPILRVNRYLIHGDTDLVDAIVQFSLSNLLPQTTDLWNISHIDDTEYESMIPALIPDHAYYQNELVGFAVTSTSASSFI